MPFKFTDYVIEKTKKEEILPPAPIVTTLVEHVEEKPQEKEITTIETKVEPKIETIDEKTEFDSLDITDDELLEIKKLALKDIIEQELNVSELIDLVLLAKTGKQVKQKNHENLVIREYVDIGGKITKNGRMYLEFDEVKERLRKLIK